MKKLNLLLLFIVFLTAISCEPEEKVIDNTVDNWNVLYAAGENYSALKLVKLPEKSIVSKDVYFDANGENLPGIVTVIKEYRDIIYLLIPEKYQMILIDSKTFEKKYSVDFTSEMLEPSDICFANATHAYISHGNDSTVTLYDIKNFAVSRKINVGLNPYSIRCSGNQIYVANRNSNSVSIIASNDNKVQETLKLSPKPSYLEFTPNGKKVLVICLGNGKIDELDKTQAVATFIDVETQKILNSVNIGFNNYKTENQFPFDLTISDNDWAFIPTNEFLARLDTRRGDILNFASNKTYSSVKYNRKRNELLLLETKDGNNILHIADPLTATLRDNIQLDAFVTAFYAY